MRLIGEFENEKQAFTFSSFLKKEGIENAYEPFEVPSSGKKGYRIWVQEEDDFPSASKWYDYYQNNPADPQFENIGPPPPPVIPTVEEATEEFKTEEKGKTLKLHIRRKTKPFSYALTHFFLLICIFLFFWNDLQEAEVLKTRGPLSVELGFTSLQRALIFDYPHAMQVFEEVLLLYPVKSLEELKTLPPEEQECFHKAENLPYWKGYYDEIMQWRLNKSQPKESAPMFEKIKQGEVWRLFTPCLLHRDFLHILFNMAWLWVLGRQIEERLRRFRMLILIIIVGIVSNIAQYLMGGPYFLGYSGIVVGMAAFIWSRQRVAPWEGYPLQRTTLLFILFFVLAMFGLELVSFGLHFFSVTQLSPSIANTAHVVGGLTGLVLGRMNYFSRGAS